MAKLGKGHRGRDCMVVGLITTYAISAYHQQHLNPAHGEVYLIQHYVIKFVTALRFLPSIKLKYC